MNTAEIITTLATSGNKSVDYYLTRPGKAVFEIIAHLTSNHPDMKDDDILAAIRPAAYQQLINEMT
jgi:hypothetical protein